MRRLTWMLVGRLVILGGLSAFGIAVLGAARINLAYGMTGAGAVVSTTAFAAWYRARPVSRLLPAAMIVFDSLLLGAIVHFAGGLDGPFAALFILHALYAGNVAGTRGGFYVALLDTFVLAASGFTAIVSGMPAGGTELLEFLGQGVPIELSTRYVFLRVLLHACLLIPAGLASGYFSETLGRESGRLKEALDALRTSTARSRDILRNLSDGILLIDGDGTPLSLNPSARRMLGLGSDWQEAVRSTEIYRILRNRNPAEGFPDRIDVVADDRIIECKLGEFEPGSPVESGAVLAVLTDVTELRTLRSRLEEREKLAVFGRLSATMAHEIRNPLASISGAAQVLRSGAFDRSRFDSLVDLIVVQSKRTSDIIEGYLELARGSTRDDTGDLRLDLVLSEVIDSARRGFAGGATIGAGPFPEVVVTGREHRLSQMFGNVIRNACEALEGTPNPEVSVHLDVDRLSRRAVVTVADNGPGVPEGILSMVTEPFFTTKEYGTGLGLYVARRVLEEHSGSMALRNRVAGGLEVEIVLPLAGGGGKTDDWGGGS
ncbi:PAS domain-containing protein [Candidatus Fermentibacteria bacterium]|nr:PAS domain-containing protein [Candidatus Fermentibacteria bacterium]